MTLTQFSFYSRNHVDVDRWFLFRRRKKSVPRVCKVEGALHRQTRIKISMIFQKSIWRLLDVESYVEVEVTRLLFSEIVLQRLRDTSLGKFRETAHLETLETAPTANGSPFLFWRQRHIIFAKLCKIIFSFLTLLEKYNLQNIRYHSRYGPI